MFDDRSPFSTHDEGPLLLTGATGFLGMEVLARYLERTDRKIYALVRAADQQAAQARIRDALAWLFGCEDAYAGRVLAVAGDLEQPQLGLSAQMRERLAEEVTDVVHSAASVSFELGLEQSRRINVEGTRGVLDLCRMGAQRGTLSGVSYVSTAYVAGLHDGRFGEEDLDMGQGFRNAYESSKFEAEQLVRTYSDVPVRVLRPSIIVGDQSTGWTSSFNVIYWPMRAFARSGYAALPARQHSPADVVPVDYVADAVFALTERGGSAGETFNITASDNAATVGEIIQLVIERFDRPAPKLLHPTLYRRVAHPLLLHTSRGARKHKLRRTEVFFPYFEVRAEFDNRHAREILEPLGIQAARFASYFDRLVDFALETDWGASRLTRADHRNMREALVAA